MTNKVTCHDGTPYVDYMCPQCGFVMHVHKSQLPPNYIEMELRTVCKQCRAELVLPVPINFVGE